LKLYVGNLAYTTMDHQLKEAFAEFGEVASASVVYDKISGRSRGFGFVEFANAAEGQRAIEAMDGAMLDGRNLRVNEAREPARRDGPGGGGGRGGGGRGAGGGGYGGGGGAGGGYGGGGRGGGGRDRRGGGGGRGAGGGDRW
jgi:RNA recognition motif-containing protein